MRTVLVRLSLFLAAWSIAGSAETLLRVGTTDFPSTIAGAGWFQITNYALDGGPGGIGASYRSDRLKADVYLYDAGDPSWISKTLDERFAREWASIPGVMQEMERRNLYTNVKLAPAADATSGTLTFSHVRITYVERNERKKSDFYLTKYRDRLLKIRLTAIESTDDDILQRAFTEAAAAFVAKL